MNAVDARIKPTNMRWILGTIMFFITFVSYMDRVNLSVAVPFIMKEFHFTKIEIGLMQTAFFLGYAIMQIPAACCRSASATAAWRPWAWPGGPPSRS